MGQPVKLSDTLILDARIAANTQERSIAGQVEFWAKLGQATEQMLDARRIQALRLTGGLESLSEAIGTVGAPEGRVRLKQYLESLPYPHFEQHPVRPDLLIRTDKDGKRTVGRFMNRQFVKVAVSSKMAPQRQGLLKAARATRKS